MIALVATICLAQGLAADNRLDASVSYVTPGESLDMALAGISKNRKFTLTVQRPFDTDIVAIRLKDAGLREFMTRVADRLKLEWRPTKAGYELYQTKEREVTAGKEIAFERLGRLRYWRQSHRDRAKLPRPDFDNIQARLTQEREEDLPDPNKNIEAYLERAQRIEALRVEGDPAHWFATAVIAGITDEQLETLLADGSITFSASPNRLQHRLPKGIEADLKTWAMRLGISEPVVLARLRMVDGFQAKVSVSIGSQDAKTSNEYFMPFDDAPLPANDRISKGTSLDAVLEIDGYLGMRWGMQNKRMPPEPVLMQIAESITDPEKREPLSTMAGAGLVEIAEETGHNLIALLSDDMIARGSESALPTNGRAMLAQFCDDVRATYTDDGTWLTVRPVEISLSRAKQFPRKYFRQIASATTRDRVLPFAEVARIVSECTDLQLEGGYFRDYLTRNAARQEFTLLRTWGDTSVFRFWHSLSMPERDGVMSGAVPIGRLDIESKNLLWRAVSLGGTTISGEDAFNQVYRGPIGSDPTVVFPNGFPSGEVLEARVKVDDCVLSSFTPWREPIWVAQSIEKFADYAEPNKADMSKIRLGKSHQVSIIVDKLAWSSNLREDIFDFSKPFINWKDAPESIRARFNAPRRNPGQPGIIIR